MGFSNFVIGWATDQMGFSPHESALGIAVLFLIPGCLWLIFLTFVRQRFEKGKYVGSMCSHDFKDFNE